MIEIVAVGAHMSGLPLNHELLREGGTLVRAVNTLPCYRLYALAGQPKPGLIRAAGGVAIETEVWRLTPAAFGRFVDAIPTPLGIGTITLADGTTARGFLAEPAGLEGATDISEYGGWRAYCARARQPA